jgi:hypothetical protein
MGPPALLPIRSCAADFYRPLKSIALVGRKPATFGPSGKHTNHYAIKATLFTLALVLMGYVRFDGRGTRPEVDCGLLTCGAV